MGCGGDSDGDRPSPPGFAPKEKFSEAKLKFIDRADRICAISIDATGQLRSDPRSALEWFIYGRSTARVLRTAIRSIVVLELPPPPEMAGARAFKRAARDILGAVRETERETRRLGDAIEDRDSERARRRIATLSRALDDVTRLDLRSTRIARDYGMDECGDDGSEPKPEDVVPGPEF